MIKIHRNSIFLPIFVRYFLLFLLLFSTEVKAQSPINIEFEEEEEISQEQLLQEAQPNSQEVRQASFPNIAEKYDSNDFDYEEKETSLLAYYFQKITNFLNRLFDFSLNSDGRKIRNLVFIAVFLIVLFIGIKFILKHKGRWLYEKTNKNLVISADDAEKHIHLADFQTLIQQAEKQNDMRQSIRLYYLWLLKSLSDKEYIRWTLEKTNSDYQREIKDPNLKTAFAQLSYLYNYVWYGEFPIEITDYQKAKADFEMYINPKKQKI